MGPYPRELDEQLLPVDAEPKDPDRPGPRHRLWMLESGWRYERPDRR